MTSEPWFEILDVSPNASRTEVDQAYQRLLTKWDSTQFPNNAEARQQAERQTANVIAAYSDAVAKVNAINTSPGQGQSETQIPQSVPEIDTIIPVDPASRTTRENIRIGCLVTFAVALLIGGLISPVGVTKLFLWCCEPETLIFILIGAFVVYAVTRPPD